MSTDRSDTATILPRVRSSRMDFSLPARVAMVPAIDPAARQEECIILLRDPASYLTIGFCPAYDDLLVWWRSLPDTPQAAIRLPLTVAVLANVEDHLIPAIQELMRQNVERQVHYGDAQFAYIMSIARL